MLLVIFVIFLIRRIPDKSYSWGILIGCVLLVATAHAFSHHSKKAAREKGRMSDPANDDIILSHGEHQRIF
jgi:hypothetical protein